MGKALVHAPIRPPRDIVGEQVFSRRWAELMATAPEWDDPTVLARILWSYPGSVNQRAASVAASFVCWLGTNVGGSVLSQGRSLSTAGFLFGDGVLAAWCVHNARRAGVNGGARAIDMLLRSDDDFGQKRLPAASADDAEVVEHVAAWLGTEAGLAFIAECEGEIRTRQDMETIAGYHSRGLGHLPVVRELESALVAKACG